MCCSLIGFLNVNENSFLVKENRQKVCEHGIFGQFARISHPVVFVAMLDNDIGRVKKKIHFAEALRCVGLPGPQQQECEDFVLGTLLLWVCLWVL